MAAPVTKGGLPVDVYTGQPMTRVVCGDSGEVMYRSQLEGVGGIVTTIGRDSRLRELLCSRVVPVLSKPAPLAVVTLVCPFTGRDLRLVQVSGFGRWVAVLDGDPGYRTVGFDLRDELVWFLGHRMGVAPKRVRRPKIRVREVAEPGANPVADLIEREKVIEDAATDFVDRHVVGVRGVVAGR